MLAPFLFNQIKNGRCPRKGDIDSMNVCIQTCENDFSCEKDQICVSSDGVPLSNDNLDYLFCKLTYSARLNVT